MTMFFFKLFSLPKLRITNDNKLPKNLQGQNDLL